MLYKHRSRFGYDLNRDANQFIIKIGKKTFSCFQLQKRTIALASGGTEVASSCAYNEEKKIDFTEIVPVREMLRKSEYLLNPMKESEHMSLNGEIKISSGLKNFTAESEHLKKVL